MTAAEHPDTGDAVADVAAVLAEHRALHDEKGYRYCTCSAPVFRSIKDHEAHVARAIVESRQP